MKNLIKVLLFVTIIISSCSKKEIIKLPITSSSSQALEFWDRAMLSFQVNDQTEKRMYLDSALIIDPGFALALEFYQSPDPLIRKEHQEKAKSLKNRITEAEKKILYIRQSYRNGDMNEALSNAEWLAKNHSDSFESFVWLAQVQTDRRELEKATKSLNKALELNPDSYDAYFLLFSQHIPHGNQVLLPEEKRSVEKGLKYADEMIRIRGDHGRSYHMKGNCYRQIGEFEKAKVLYEEAIVKRRGLSSEGTAHLISGHNYMFSGDMETARQRYNSAIELTKENPNLWSLMEYYLTVSYIFDNDYIGAIENINKLEKQIETIGFDRISLLERKGQLNFQKLICYAHNQMEDDAYSSLENLFKLNWERASLLNDENITRNVTANEQYQKAWVNILFGKYEKAKKNLGELKKIQEARNDPTAMYGYHSLSGMAHLMEGNYELAIENFNKGDETDIYFNYFKGLSLKAQGKKEESLKIFKDLSNINFSNWDIAIIRGLAKNQLGEA